MKAVESAPDARGHREIWHAGGVEADLVSHVDATGRVLQQELRLFDDYLVWRHGARLRTGRVRPRTHAVAPRQDEIDFDLTPSRELLERARLAAETYRGADPYVQHLVRMLGVHGMAGAAVVTRPSHELLQRRLQRELKRDTARSSLRYVYVAVGAAALTLAMLLMGRLR